MIVENVDPNGFAKPIEVNDWGMPEWYLQAVKSDMGTWGHSDQDPAQRLNAGDVVEVLWPNGDITIETLNGEPVYSSVSDHGHIYPTTYVRLSVTATVRGQQTHVSLDGLRMRRPR